MESDESFSRTPVMMFFGGVLILGNHRKTMRFADHCNVQCKTIQRTWCSSLRSNTCV